MMPRENHYAVQFYRQYRGCHKIHHVEMYRMNWYCYWSKNGDVGFYRQYSGCHKIYHVETAYKNYWYDIDAKET
jgi:hypothetical protein